MDMLYYIKQMPKMMKSNVNLYIDKNKSALEQLFEEEEKDGEFIVPDEDL